MDDKVSINLFAKAMDMKKIEHGEMERIKGEVFPFWRCSACKKVNYLEPPRGVNFCPGCGAQMDAGAATPRRSIEHHSFLTFDHLEDDSPLSGFSTQMSVAIRAQVVDLTNKAIVDACKKWCAENNISDLYLIDEQFLINAINRAKAESQASLEITNP